METLILWRVLLLITRGRIAAVGELGGMWRRCAAREGVEARELVDGKVVAGRGRPAALGADMLGDVGHLMGLLSVVDHLLISPLSVLVVGGVVVRVLGVDLLLVRVGAVWVDRIGRLVLIKVGVELLGRVGGRPGSLLLLLDRVRVGLLVGHGVGRLLVIGRR